MTDALRVVKVVWVDPHSVDPWTDNEELLNEDICKIISIGILMYETKDKYVLTLNYCPSGNDSSCVIILPKCCVLHISEVAFVKKILEP